MNLIPLPAFQDDDLWLLHDGHKVRVEEPGDSPPQLACLQRERLQLRPILVTHRERDHVSGRARLDCQRAESAVRPVFAHAGEPPNTRLIHSRA